MNDFQCQFRKDLAHELCRLLLKHHKLKIRFKSLQRRKKEERLLLDMPTTDPGSDLLFSTDDEYIDANGLITCYGTMPPRIKRHLLKSELQRRYIEEIGDGLKNMPPELIITSPSNKDKQKKHSIRIIYNTTNTEKYQQKYKTIGELPFIGQQPVKRTRSWHNLNTLNPVTLLNPGKTSATKNKSQSPFYRPLSKKEILSKEDLDIKLSLKKKIWTGIQPDDISMGVDRTRPLSWLAPHSLKSKKIIGDQSFSNDFNYFLKLPNGYSNKKLENEAFLTACSRKLMEWQTMNTNPDKPFPCGQKTKVPVKLVAPDINEDRSMFLFKHLSNMKAGNVQKFLAANDRNEINDELKPKRNTIPKVVETSKIFTKLSKSKSRHTGTNAYRSASKQTLNPHKVNVRSNKFKTGGIVVTAVQTGASVGIGASKKNKKVKALHYKLPQVNNYSTNNNDCIETFKTSTHYSGSNNNKNSLVLAATATTMVRKVKTKLKKKKSSPSIKQSETTIH